MLVKNYLILLRILMLKKNGILVRHFDAPRIENWLRITIGTPEQMQALMDAVDKILEV